MVGNAPAPASFAAPLLNFAPLANMPKTYFEGQQSQRTLALQNAFPNGLPRNQDGSVDVNATTDTLVRLGGAPYAQDLLKFLMARDAGTQAGRNIEAIDQGISGAPSGNAPSGSATAVPGASGPSNIRGPGAAPQQPVLSSAGTDNNGADTLRSVATETFGGRDVSAMIPRYAAALGVRADDPLTPQQVTQARRFMARTAQASPADDSGGGVKTLPATGNSGAPAPAGPGGTETASPSAGIVPQGPVAQPQGAPTGTGAAGIPYAQYPGMMQRLSQASTNARAAAASIAGFNPSMAQQYEKQADSYDARRKQLFDEYQQVLSPTPEQKNLASGATQRGEELKNEVTQSQKTYNGIQAAATQYERDLRPYLDISRSVLNDPSMYTGTGANLALNFNRIRAMFGDQRAAMLQEALQKVTASSVLGQINTQRDQLIEAGGASNRIFAQQIALVEKAAPALANTLGGNRFLVEVSSRMGNLSSRVAEMARDYITTHGHLDPKFDRQLANWMKANPLFTKDEMSHPELLGAPSIPPALNSPEKIMAWTKAMGLKPGDAMRAPDGRYKMIPNTPPAVPVQ